VFSPSSCSSGIVHNRQVIPSNANQYPRYLPRTPVCQPCNFLNSSQGKENGMRCESVIPCNLFGRLLRRWRARRWLVDIVTSSVCILRRLHLNLCLSSTKVSLAFPVVTSRVLRLGVVGWGLLLVVAWLLGLVIRIVCGWTMSPRRSSNPASPVHGLSSCTTSSTSTKAAAQEEDEECADENDGESDPPPPVIP